MQLITFKSKNKETTNPGILFELFVLSRGIPPILTLPVTLQNGGLITAIEPLNEYQKVHTLCPQIIR